MRISDWSSDVCSSDLILHPFAIGGDEDRGWRARVDLLGQSRRRGEHWLDLGAAGFRIILREFADRVGQAGGGVDADLIGDRKSVVSGKSVSVRVDLGGRRIIKIQTKVINILLK